MSTMTRTGDEADADDMDVIDAHLGHLKRSGCSPETLVNRRRVLRRLDRELPFGIAVVAVEDLRVWLYREEWQQGYRASLYTIIKSFYDWSVGGSRPWLTLNPAAELEAVHHPQGHARPCSDQDLSAILRRAAEPYRTWATIAAYQGLRCCEIAGLDREHITEAQLIVVRGKGGRPRIHDCDPYVWRAVRRLPPGPIARLVRGPRAGQRAAASHVSDNAEHHFRHAVGVDVTMHQLRHWCGVNVQRAYRDIRVTQEILGHRSLSSTQIYTDATLDQQRAARAAIPRLAG